MTLNVPASIGSLELGGTTGTQTLKGTAKNLSIGTASHIAAHGVLDLASDSLSGPGALAVQGNLILKTTIVAAPIDVDGVVAARVNSKIIGPITTTANATVRIEASAFGYANVIIQEGFTNNGVLLLTTSYHFLNSALTVAHGTLINSATGVVAADAGAGGGTRTLTAELENHGTLRVDVPLTLNGLSAHHTSSGSIRVTGGDLTVIQSGAGASFETSGDLQVALNRTMKVDGGTFANFAGGTIEGLGTLDVVTSSFTNSGTLSPGPPLGLFVILGSVRLTPTSVVKVDIGRTSNNDRIALSGDIEMSGAMEISLVDGFSPQPGDQFILVNSSHSTGAFDRLTGLDAGNGRSFFPSTGWNGFTVFVVGQTWIRELPLGGDPGLARSGHSAVFDSLSDRLIVFGGSTASGPTNDVWVLTHADNQGGQPQWIRISPAGDAPPARAHHSAVFNTASDRMIVFGGDDGGSTRFGDTWMLSNADGLGGSPTWFRVKTIGTPPPARAAHSVAYDEAMDRMIITGGQADSACGEAFNDVWTLSDATGQHGTPTWTQLFPSGSPPRPFAACPVILDAGTGSLLLIEGHLCDPLAFGYWRLTGVDGVGSPSWSELSPFQASGSLTNESAVFDPATRRVTLFGGAQRDSHYVYFGLGMSTFNIDAPLTDWIDLSPVGAPPPGRYDHAAVQTGNHRMIVYGGIGDSGLLSDVFVLDEVQGRVLGVQPGGPGAVPPGGSRLAGFTQAPSPNPSRARFRFAIGLSRRQHVELSVCDLAGRRVATLQSGTLGPGEHSFEWRPDTARGGTAPGIYWIRLDTDEGRFARSVVLTR